MHAKHMRAALLGKTGEMSAEQGLTKSLLLPIPDAEDYSLSQSDNESCDDDYGAVKGYKSHCCISTP